MVGDHNNLKILFSKNESKKFLFITGDLIKHKYLAIKLMHHYSASRIIIESYPKEISKNYSPDKNRLLVIILIMWIKQTKKFLVSM